MRSLRPASEVNCLYSPSCREGVFSETHIHGGETLCIRTGGERWHRSDRYTLLPQDVGVVDGYAGAALGPGRSEGVERHIDQGAPHPIVTLRSPWSESTRYIFSGSCPTFDVLLPYKNPGFCTGVIPIRTHVNKGGRYLFGTLSVPRSPVKQGREAAEHIPHPYQVRTSSDIGSDHPLWYRIGRWILDALYAWGSGRVASRRSASC
jgi:hypothetical protein